MKNAMKYPAGMAIVCAILLFHSCESTPKSFDKALLSGTWVVEGNETDHWKFNEDGTGASWDTQDDVTEEEADAFTWTLTGSDFVITHTMEIGGAVIPKQYEMLELAATHMEYRDVTTKATTALRKL